jgi:hypothetical protein
MGFLSKRKGGQVLTDLPAIPPAADRDEPVSDAQLEGVRVQAHLAAQAQGRREAELRAVYVHEQRLRDEREAADKPFAIEQAQREAEWLQQYRANMRRENEARARGE